MRNKVSSIETVPYAGVTPNSLNNNAFEQRVVKDYMNQKRMNNIQFKNDILAK